MSVVKYSDSQVFIFITSGYSRDLPFHIPLGIQLTILSQINPSILCEWEIYLFYILIKHHQIHRAKNALSNIRYIASFYDCGQDIDNDIALQKDDIAKKQKEDGNNLLFLKIGRCLPLIRTIEDSIRGKIWRLLLGLRYIDSNNYQTQIKKSESRNYNKIRYDTKRTFLTSEEYNYRVSEERLVRVLNSFDYQYETYPYCQGSDGVAAVLLYVMPELSAYESYQLLRTKHLSTYFYFDKTRKNDIIGSYAASYLALDILKICDHELFFHLRSLPAHTYFLPLVASVQCLCQPFTELLKLWDFLVCFGFHLNPVIAAAQIIAAKQLLLDKDPARLLQSLLSQRKWMNRTIDAKKIIKCCKKIIIVLKGRKHKQLWHDILYHSNNMDVAAAIRMNHIKGSGILIDEQNDEDDNHMDTNSSNKNEDQKKQKNDTNTVELNKEINESESTMGEHGNDDNNEYNKSSNNVKESETMDKQENDEDEKINTENMKTIDNTSEVLMSDSEESTDSSSGWTERSSDAEMDTNEYSIPKIRFVRLNEFELNEDTIDAFNKYERIHNGLLSKNYTEFIESEKGFVAMDCDIDEIIKTGICDGVYSHK